LRTGPARPSTATLPEKRLEKPSFTNLPALRGKGGKSSKAIKYDQPNVYLTLQGLCNMGLVEKDATKSPHVYRLTVKLRVTN